MSAELQSYVFDCCCSPALRKAIAVGELDGVIAWTCPKCGETWKATVQTSAAVLGGEQGIKHWEPVPMLAVFRM